MEATQETKRRRRGEVREDGMVFWCYASGSNTEIWRTNEWVIAQRDKERQKAKEIYQSNPQKFCARKKEYREAKQKEVSEEQKAKRREYAREYRKNNFQKVRQNQERYLARNREKVRERLRQWQLENRKNNPSAAVAHKMRSRIRKIVLGFFPLSTRASFSWTGCNKQGLRAHLEARFSPGMTWENMGKDGWHIDHIIPLACAKSLKHLEALCHYLNLQPLWAKENLSKGDKIPETIPDNIKHLLPENWNE